MLGRYEYFHLICNTKNKPIGNYNKNRLQLKTYIKL